MSHRKEGGRGPGRISYAQLAATKGCKYNIGQEVLCRWNDGLFYLGNIIRVDEDNERVFVRFEDNSEYWVLYKDIHKGANQGEISCCVCQGETSEMPNEIVLCDNCGLGYHQQCHNPPIDSEVLKPGVAFLCRLCVFATTVKRGGALKKGPNVKAFQAMKLSLPYNLHRLTWDAQHKTNVEQCYCYCGGPGDWYMKMMQCCRCRQWFHEACIQCLISPLLYGDRFYLFVCSHCNSGPEYIKRLDLKWVDIVQLTLFNLTIQQAKKYYDLEEVIIPWILEHRDHLQLPEKYGDIANEEAITLVLEALQTHKSRFSWGREIKKKNTLWGLRVRIPPPAPTVILPTDGCITDEVMSNLQMKGRKTKTFVPIQCNSPVPIRYKRKVGMDIDDSIVFKSKKAKKLLLEATQHTVKNNFSPHQQYAGYNGYSPYECNNFCNKSSWQWDDSKQCTLDSIIPTPPSFEGHHHPFKTVLEQNEELEKQAELQERLLTLCQNSCDEETASHSSGISSSLESHSESLDDLKPPVLVEERASRGLRRKIWDSPPQLSPKKRGRPRRVPVSPPKLSKSVTNVVDPATIHAVKSQEVPLKQLKSSVSNYFGAANRLAQGEKFQVLARRITADGKVQYLVQWHGLVT